MVEFASLGLKIDSRQVLAGKKALDGLSRAGDRAGASAGRLKTKFNRLKKATGGLVAEMRTLKGAAVLGAVILAFKSVVGVAATFEQSIADLSAITGATGKDLKFLSDAAKEFGETTTLSASQVAEAFKLVASAKPDLLTVLPALKEVTRQVITLAEAASIDVPLAAEILGGALNQFSADASRAAEFINVLAAGAKLGSSEIASTAAALSKAGTVASNTGISFLSLNAAIQTLAKFTLKGTEAGTALKGVFLKLSSKARSEFNPAVVGMSQAFKNLAAAQLNTKEQLKLFGEEGITAAQILTGNIKLLKMYEQTLKGTNTAQEQAAKKVNTLSGDWKKFKSVLEGATIFIGETLNPVIRKMLQHLTDSVAVIKWLSEIVLVSFTGGLLLLTKGFILVRTAARLFWDDLIRGGEATSIFAQVAIELEAIDSLLLKTISDADVLLGIKSPDAVVDVDTTGAALVKAIADKAARQEAARQAEFTDQAEFQEKINAAAKIQIAADDAAIIEKKEKEKAALDEKLAYEMETQALINAAAHAQIAREDAAIEAKKKKEKALLDKTIAAEKIAQSTIYNMRVHNQNKILALAKTAAGGNKAALLAILAAETALSIARITAATEANAALFLPAAPAIRAQGALSRALVIGAAAIGAAGIVGQAHDGLSTVPRTGTFILEKGERVVKKEDNKLLTRALENGQFGGATIVVNIDAAGSVLAEDVIRRAAEEGAALGYERVANDMRRGGPIRSIIS